MISEKSLLRRIGREEINALPVRQFNGEIRLVRTGWEWESAAKELADADLLGFDTETKPSFRKGSVNPTALLQLATGDKVFLVQLTRIPFSAAQASILANPRIIKAGVGIYDDLSALRRLHPFEPAGHIDIGKIAEINKLPNHGLRTLAASLFGWRISKGSRCSNWNRSELSRRQMEYAATDAWISREIFLRMQALGLRGISQAARS